MKLTDLTTEIQAKFSNDDPFLENFRKTVAQHYNRILHKGFAVTVNKKAIKPAIVSFLSIPDLRKQGIAPYLFHGRINDVDVEIVAGFYRPSLDEERT